MSDGISDGNAPRSLDDIHTTGVSWCTESEFDDICEELKVARIRIATQNHHINDLKAELSVNMLRTLFRHADAIDWDWLFERVGGCAYGRFWKAVFTEVRSALEKIK